MSLNLESIQKAISALEAAVAVSENKAFMDNLRPVERNVIHSGVIQHFEFTYELCWKFIQRWIRLNNSPEDAEPRTRKELFRLAAKVGLIQNPGQWFLFTEARNLTSHTYNEAKADQVYASALDFLPESQFLCQQLEARND